MVLGEMLLLVEKDELGSETVVERTGFAGLMSTREVSKVMSMVFGCVIFAVHFFLAWVSGLSPDVVMARWCRGDQG